MTIHPQIIEKDGSKEFAVIPYREFLAMQEMIEDFEDLMALQAARAEDPDAPGIPYETARKELGLDKAPKKKLSRTNA